MQTFVSATQVVLAISYTLLVVACARAFASGRKGLGIFARPLLVGTVALHLLALGVLGAERRACPLGSQAEFLSLTAFTVTLIYLILEIRIRESSTGVFAVTVPFVLQVIATVSILGTEIPTTQKLGLQASFHSFAAIIGFSAVLLCSVYSLLYLFLYTAIKRGRFGLFFRKMPPLEKLSDLNFITTVLAFLAVTVNVVLGFVGAFKDPSTVSFGDSEVILTLILWVLYGGAIAGRKFFGLGGKRLAYTTLTGLVILVLILVGGGLSGGTFHGP